jgi:hypothetical protein
MAYEAMFATISPFLVIYDNTTKASINLQKLTELHSLTLAWMLTIIQTPPRSNFPLFDLHVCTKLDSLTLSWMLAIIQTPLDRTSPFLIFMFAFSPFGIIP